MALKPKKKLLEEYIDVLQTELIKMEIIVDTLTGKESSTEQETQLRTRLSDEMLRVGDFILTALDKYDNMPKKIEKADKDKTIEK